MVTRSPTSVYKPSYIHCPGDEPLFALTLGQLVQKAAEQWGEREALVSVYEEQRYSFRELLEKADRLAAGLLQLGLKPGDRVAIWGPNSSDWYISRTAVARAGLIAVQIDPAYQPPELLHALVKVEAKALICAEQFKCSNCYESVQTLIPELNDSAEVGIEISSSKLPALKILIVMSNKQYRGAYRLKDIISSASPEYIEEINQLQTLIQPDDGCTIQFSSGTTGNPKAALQSHHAMVNISYFFSKNLEFDTMDGRLCVVTQFCHVVGVYLGIICSLQFGYTVILPSPTFDAKKTLEAIIQERCTHLMATPSLYVDLISTSQDLNLKVTTLQVAGYGGAPCSPQLALQIKEILNVRRLCPTFGMTEVSGVFVSKPQDSLEQTTDTVGHIVEHCEVKVVDREGRMVPMGTPGELWVRGYNVMLGYYCDEEKTREFIRPDGWAKTGDQFVLQEDGYARIVGRLKDVIIRIGDKIFPSEIEEFFETHPDVIEAEAFGVPDSKVGEEICVYLRLRDGVTISEQDVIDYCKDKIAYYRIPRYIRFTNEFKRSSTSGKVLKKHLLAKLLSEISTTN